MIGIGTPFPGPPNATCTFSLDGMYLHREPSRQLAGEDTLQALLLVVRFVGMQLQHFRDHGGRIVYRGGGDGDDTDVPVEATFGPLLIKGSAS